MNEALMSLFRRLKLLWHLQEFLLINNLKNQLWQNLKEEPLC